MAVATRSVDVQQDERGNGISTAVCIHAHPRKIIDEILPVRNHLKLAGELRSAQKTIDQNYIFQPVFNHENCFHWCKICDYNLADLCPKSCVRSEGKLRCR